MVRLIFNRASRYSTRVALLVAIAGIAFAQVPPNPAVLWEQATTYRDEWGVPNIQAENLVAMSFAFGYAQAEDHIEGMLSVLRGERRAAEVYGEGMRF